MAKGRAAIPAGIRPPRPPSVLLRLLGPPDCPPDLPPSGALVRECRWALGLSQRELAWRLGASNRKSSRVGLAEAGARTLSRGERLLLRQLLLQQQQAEAAYDWRPWEERADNWMKEGEHDDEVEPPEQAV